METMVDGWIKMCHLQKDVHHLCPRSRGGTDSPRNLLRIHIYRHVAWHRMFGNMAFEEVIAFLNGLSARQEDLHWVVAHQKDWEILWCGRAVSIPRALGIFYRLKRVKYYSHGIAW